MGIVIPNVPFIDSAALGMLALAHKNLKLANRQLILVASQEYVLRVLELANIHKMMPIVATEHEAGMKPACLGASSQGETAMVFLCVWSTLSGFNTVCRGFRIYHL